MKKILFALQTMVMGGVEKELLTILHCLDPKEYQASVLVMYVQDPSMMKKIPSWVTMIDLKIDKKYYCSDTLTAAKERVKRGKTVEAVSLLGKKLLKIGQTGSNVNISEVPALPEKYDTAVCYHMHSPLVLRYIAEKIRADRKVAWIHNDFFTTGYRADRLRKYLDRYDSFAAVSDKIKMEFLSLNPQYDAKIRTVHNILDKQEIRLRAQEPIDETVLKNTKNRLFLLTVGRMEEQKGYDIAVETAEIIKKAKLPFVWYFIGYGSKEEEVWRMIKEKNLNDCVIPMGRKDNPYSYMKACDIYVQPSRHEGYGLTVAEAKLLEKPIVCTDFAGADEQIEDGISGIIVPCNQKERLAEAILTLAGSAELQRRFRNALREESKTDSGLEDILSCL